MNKIQEKLNKLTNEIDSKKIMHKKIPIQQSGNIVLYYPGKKTKYEFAYEDNNKVINTANDDEDAIKIIKKLGGSGPLKILKAALEYGSCVF